MDNIQIGFENVAVGLLAFPWLVVALDLLFAPKQYLASALKRLTGDDRPDIQVIPIAAAAFVALVVAYSLGACMFPLADAVFDRKWPGLKSDDAIKVEVYVDRVAQVELSDIPQTLTEAFNDLKAFASYEKAPTWPENISPPERPRQAVKTIYSAQKHALMTHSAHAHEELTKLKSNIVVLRGAATNVLILAGLLLARFLYQVASGPISRKLCQYPRLKPLLHLFPGTLGGDTKPYSLNSAVVAIACILTFYAASLGLTHNEREYDENIIGMYSAISPKHDTSHWNQVYLGTDKLDGDEVKIINVFAEIPKGGTRKLEVDPDTGSLLFDRFVFHKGGYPANYGAIPQTIAGDGDPLDAIIIGPEEGVGRVVPCEVLGVMRMTDDGEQDDKLIVRRYSEPTEKASKGQPTSQIGDAMKEDLRSWFATYKDEVQSPTFGSKAEALYLLRVSRKAWDEAQRVRRSHAPSRSASAGPQ